METLIITLIIVIALAIIIASKSDKTIVKNYAKGEYKYTKKSCIMTKTELVFYKTLHETVSGCAIIPQAHLSMFLDHKVRGQNWSRAFSRINGKSVDFLICTNDMKPLISIELDDNTHDRLDRQKRDYFVNSITDSANIPLLRFKAGEWNSEIIKQRITYAIQASTLER